MRSAGCDFGTRRTALQWLQSFVSDRLQYIATTALSSDVPKGSILEPLLYLRCRLYVSPTNDIVRAHQVQYRQYADDLMLYTAPVPSMFSDLSSIADCTDAVSAWFMKNALLLNAGKTEAVIFGTRQRLADLDITGWRQRCR